MTVHDRYHGKRISSVAELTDRKMTLADGSQWLANGTRQWGSSRKQWYSGPSVYAYQEGDEEKIERASLAEALQRTEAKGLTNDQLRRIIAITHHGSFGSGSPRYISSARA